MTSAQTVDYALGTTAIAEGMRACRTCGIATSGPTQRAPMHARVLPDGRIEDLAANVHAEFAECPDCTERGGTAASIIAANPMPRYGSQSILVYRLSHALVAIAAIGQTAPTADQWTRTMITAALDRLESVGREFTWAARFSPVVRTGARADTAASSPFLYADIEVITEAKRQFAEFLLDQREPHPIACPDGGGCVVCGIGTSDGRRTREAWTPITNGPHRDKHMCSPCSAHYDGQVIGASLVDLAVLDVVDPAQEYRRKREHLPKWKASVPWIDSGAPVSTRRFAHLPLAAMRRTLQTGTW
jgi:hypothetical protein